MRCVLTGSNTTRLPICMMFFTRSPLLNVSTYAPSVLCTVTDRSNMRVSINLLAAIFLRTLTSRQSRAETKIYAGEELDGRLQALSLGRFATIWACVAVTSVNTVTNSQPSSPSLFNSVNSSLGLWICWTTYSHFCMTIRPSAPPLASPHEQSRLPEWQRNEMDAHSCAETQSTSPSLNLVWSVGHHFAEF